MLSEGEGAIMALSVPAACQEGKAWGNQLSGVAGYVGRHSTNHILMYFYDLLFWERPELNWLHFPVPQVTVARWHQQPWAVHRQRSSFTNSSLCPVHWSCFTYRGPGGCDQHCGGCFAKQILSCCRMSLSQLFATTFTTLSMVKGLPEHFSIQ